MIYRFTLILTKPTVGFEEAADRLYAAGCDDATFGACCDVYTLDFDREAATLEEAIAFAKADVEKANIGSVVDLVELPEGYEE